MKSILIGNIVILVIATALGFWLQAQGAADGEKLVAQFGLAPALWPWLFPCIGAGLMVIIAIAKASDLSQKMHTVMVEKSDMRFAAALMCGPLLALLMQSGLGLLHFDLASKQTLLISLTVFSLIYFTIMGNYASTLPPGAKGGLRTPWTMRDDAVWRRTHRFLGRGLLLVSLGGFVALLIAPEAPVIYGHFASVVSVKGAAIVYSFFCWRSLSSQQAI